MTDFKLRTQSVVAKMAATYLLDGYELIVKMESLSLMFYKFRHLKNGGILVVKAYPLDNLLFILHNGKQVKLGKIIN